MKFYNYQRSRSFTDLCPGCLRFSILSSSLNLLSWSKSIYKWSPCGVGSENLYMEFGKNYQDVRPAYIWLKPFENFLLRTWKAKDLETWYAALGTGPTRFIQMVTIDWRPVLNMKCKQCISKFQYWKTELWKYTHKVQVLDAKELRLQKQTCSPTWALVSVVTHRPLVTGQSR